MKLKKIKEVEAENLKKWWESLNDNRGHRAVLRRADHPDDALLTPAFASFLRMTQLFSQERDDSSRLFDLAVVASVLARVKNNTPDNLPRCLAKDKDGENRAKSVMSELRFQQLQKSRTPEEFFTRICRAVNLLNGKVNVISLADDILYWLGEHRFGTSSRPQERLAVRWATDYYENFRDK